MNHVILRALLKEYYNRSQAYYYALHEDDKIKSGSTAENVHRMADDYQLQADRVGEAFKSFSNGEKMYNAFNALMIRYIWAEGSYIGAVIRKSKVVINEDKAKAKRDGIKEQIDIMIGVLK